MTLAISKMDGHAHINTSRRERLPKKTKSTSVLATKGLPERQSASFIKVSGQMRSDTFKRRPAFNFTVTILA